MQETTQSAEPGSGLSSQDAARLLVEFGPNLLPDENRLLNIRQVAER